MPSHLVPDTTNGAYTMPQAIDDGYSPFVCPPQAASSTNNDIMSLKRDREREGRCADCGIQTHKVIFIDAEASPSMPRTTKDPLTIENEVHRGRCLLCHPLPGAKMRPHSTAPQHHNVNSTQVQTHIQAAPGANIFFPDTMHSSPPTAPDTIGSSSFHRNETGKAHEIPRTSISPPPSPMAESILNTISAEEALNNTNFDTFDICDIIAVMRQFPSSSTIQEKGCKQLWIQSYDDDTSIAIGRVGGISTVVDAMRHHTHNATLQQYACEALQNLASCNDYNRDVVADMGGIAAITEAMRIHRYVMGVQTRGCASLANIATGSMDNKVNVAECGGIDAVVRAVEAFPGEEKVVLAAYQVLRVLGYNFQHGYGLVDIKYFEC